MRLNHQVFLHYSQYVQAPQVTHLVLWEVFSD